MKNVVVEIIGTSPLLQHRFGEANEQDGENGTGIRRVHIQKEDPRTAAEKVAYIAPDGTHYFSSAAIIGLLTEAGASHKQRGSRKTLRFVVPAAVRMSGDTISIRNAEAGKLNGEVKRCEVDSRPVTIPSTKGRIMRHRPRYNLWGASFELRVDDRMLEAETVHQLLTEGGDSIGIGDFRPAKRGPFGTFRVVRFEEQPTA